MTDNSTPLIKRRNVPQPHIICKTIHRNEKRASARTRCGCGLNDAPPRLLTLIWRFIVMQNSVMKYSTRIGQNTGMLNISKHVHSMPMAVLFMTAYQNLNSGRRRMNGRNSSLERVGSSGPPSSAAIALSTHDQKQFHINTTTNRTHRPDPERGPFSA